MANPATNKNSNEILDFFIKNLWGKRAKGLQIPVVDIFATVTSENIEYLLNLYPFLQMISTTASFEGEIIPRFITAKSGWCIHDYGEAMSSSLGTMLYTAGEYRELPKTLENFFTPNQTLFDQKNNKITQPITTHAKDDDDDDGGDEGGGTGKNKPGHGTIIKQAYDTALEMVQIAQGKNWPGVQIIAGTPVMQWATWLAAKEKNMEVRGYSADKIAEDKRQRLKTLPELLKAKFKSPKL